MPSASGGATITETRFRSESAEEAARIDERIAAAWRRHPRRFFIESEKDFMAKAAHALELISAEAAGPAGARYPGQQAAEEPFPAVSAPAPVLDQSIPSAYYKDQT